MAYIRFAPSPAVCRAPLTAARLRAGARARRLWQPRDSRIITVLRDGHGPPPRPRPCLDGGIGRRSGLTICGVLQIAAQANLRSKLRREAPAGGKIRRCNAKRWHPCRDGGIGRRSGLKIRRRKVWGFESPSRHQITLRRGPTDGFGPISWPIGHFLLPQLASLISSGLSSFGAYCSLASPQRHFSGALRRSLVKLEQHADCGVVRSSDTRNSPGLQGG